MSPLKQFESAALAAEIAKELNQNNFSPALRTALLNSARAEDGLAIKTLLARYKKSTAVEFHGTFDRLEALDKRGRIVYSIEIDPRNPKRFAINGNEWTMPDTGSIIKSLNQSILGQSSEKKSASTDLFFATAFASNSPPVSIDTVRAATYIFISAYGDRGGQKAAGYLENRDVQSALLHGDGFPNGRSKLDSWLSFWGPTEVKCTSEGAKGFALISGTSVEFLAKPDATLIVKSKGHSQPIAFLPRSINLRKRSADARADLSLITPAAAGADSAEVRHTKARNAMSRIVDHCRLAVVNYVTLAPNSDPDFCGDAMLFADRNSRRALTDRGVRQLGMDVMSIRKEEYIREQYLNDVVPWLIKNRDRALALFNKTENFVAINDQTGAVEACLNDDCSKTTAEDTNYLRGYRVPPNEIEKSVQTAIAFKPTTSPGSKATIEFKCPTKNHACKSVGLTDEAGLSGKDLERAYELIESANRSLAWEENDPSVSRPVSTLRALGPCCEDSNCRAAVIKRGANLVPAKGTKSKGVAQ